MNERQQKYFQQGLLEGQEYKGFAASIEEVYVRGIAELLHASLQEARQYLIKSYRQRLDAQPSPEKYPELIGMRDCVLAYHRGIAQSSGLTEDEVAIAKNYLFAVTRALSDQQAASSPPIAEPSEPGCTLVYFPDSERGPLLGNNTDDHYRPGFRAEPTWLVANRAGLMLGTVSSGIIGDEVSPEIFPAPVFLLVYEMCSTTAEAVELLTRLNLFWGPCNSLVADREGNSAIIEKSTCRYGVRRSSDGFSATTAMAAEEPKQKEYLWQTRERSLQERNLNHDSVDWAYWKAAESRSSRLLKMLDDAKSTATYAAMENILYDNTGEPNQICLDGGKCHPDEEFVNWTLRSVIHVINERRAFYSFCDPPLGAQQTPRHEKKFTELNFAF